jgi:hypothetical protein
MKKTAFILVLFCFTSLVAAAKHHASSPGDPPGNQQSQPTFTLSSGYFSFFGLFSTPLQKTDTTLKHIVPVQQGATPQRGTSPKK